MPRKKTREWVLVMCCILCFLGSCASSATSQAYYESLSVNDPDLSVISDGRYTGEHKLDPPFGVYVAQNHVELEVVITNHTYDDIVVKTESIRTMEHIKKMRQLIIDNQTLQIDALSGATSLTGKAYLKAIENALE